MNEHEGHDLDCAHEQECARCGEITPTPAEHACQPTGWQVIIYPPDCCFQEDD